MSWLGTDLLGELLSTNFLCHTRTMGVYTAEDFQSSYTQCDANSVLELLECLDLCVQVEYHFVLWNYNLNNVDLLRFYCIGHDV